MRFSASAARACKKLLAVAIDICCAKATDGECYGGRIITYETIASSGKSVLCHNTTLNSITYYFAKLKAASIYACAALLPVAFFLSAQPTYASVTGPGSAWQYVRKITLSPCNSRSKFPGENYTYIIR